MADMAPRSRRADPIGATEPPDLLAEELASVELVSLEARFDLQDVQVRSARLAGADASAGNVCRSHLRDVDLAESKLRALALRDVLAEQVGAANGDWSGARVRRVQFSDSRLTGLSLAEAEIEESSFTACKLDFANFRNSSLKRVSFEDCVLTGADFQGARIDASLFRGCELIDTDFSGARLSRVDLRGSRLALAGSVRGMRGAIVDSVQLIDLAEALADELGILVEDLPR